MMRWIRLGCALVLVTGSACAPGAGSSDGRPSVDAGPDRCVGEGDTLTLVATSEGVGGLDYRWSLERRPDGAEDVEIIDLTSGTATTSELTVQGDYVFRIIAANRDGLSASSWVTVTVGSPGAGGDFCVSIDGPATITAGEETTFTATTAREGDLSYAWEAITTNGVTTNGVVFTTPQQPSTTVTAETPGEVILRVTVTDPEAGEVGTAELQVTVSELSVSIDGPTTVTVGEPFDLTATVENSVGDLTYTWHVPSEQFSTNGVTDQQTIEVTAIGPGQASIRVDVEDSETGESASASITITARELTVTASAAAPLLRVEDEVTLTASVEGDFQSVGYAWRVEEGPGSISAGADQAQATLTASGSGTIRAICQVTASDDDGDPLVGEAEAVVVSYEPGETDSRPEVLIEVQDFGTIGIALEVDAAPETVANFLRYVDEQFYDGVLFHRVVPDFVIQGGGFVPGDDGPEPKEPTRPPVESEAPNGLSNIRGTVAMALSGNDADSGDTQFFINLDDNSRLDEGPPPFTVFAEVVEGMDVVDVIAAVHTHSVGGLDDLPATDVVMLSVRRASSE